MHKYLRAVGFSDFRKRDLEILLDEIIEHPEMMRVTRDSEENEFAELSREFAPNIGITVRGIFDDNDKFEIDYTYDTDKTTKSVNNVNKPSVRKVVIDEQGNMINNIDDTFTFGLYNSDYKLVSTVFDKMDLEFMELSKFEVSSLVYPNSNNLYSCVC